MSKKIELLTQLIADETPGQAPSVTARHGTHYEFLIAIGNDHTAHVTMTDEAMEALSAIQDDKKTEPEEFIQRIIAEKQELDEKLEKLKAFLLSDKSDDIEHKYRRLLFEQHIIMEKYARVLDARIRLYLEDLSE